MRETWEHQPDAGPVAMVDGEWQPLGTTEHGATFREVIERETVQSLADGEHGVVAVNRPRRPHGKAHRRMAKASRKANR